MDRIEELAQGESRAREEVAWRGALNTFGLDPLEREKQSVEYAKAQARLMKASRELREAIESA